MTKIVIEARYVYQIVEKIEQFFKETSEENDYCGDKALIIEIVDKK